MTTISKFVTDNQPHLLKNNPDAILTFFQKIEDDAELLHDYETLLARSTSKSVNSQIGRRVCEILAGKAVGRQHATGTRLIGSYSLLSF